MIATCALMGYIYGLRVGCPPFPIVIINSRPCVMSANHAAQMFSKLAVFGLVAFATAAEMVSEGSGDDSNVVEGEWAESSSVLSVQTLMQSNTSAVVVPTACRQGCPCCTPKIVRGSNSFSTKPSI